jgi:hypothetical protein
MSPLGVGINSNRVAMCWNAARTEVCSGVEGHSLTYLLTYRALLEKLTGSQLLKKFPTFYGTRRFIITFANARQLSLS